MGRSGALFVLCVGQQGGSFGIVGLGREGSALGKGVRTAALITDKGFSRAIAEKIDKALAER